MSWNDYYRRRDVMETVLRLAARDPEGPLPFAEVSGAREAFGSEEQLLLALHYKWTQVLSGHLRAELLGEDDHVDAVTRAWRAAVRGNRALRAVLDANLDRSPALRPVHEAEVRMLAIAAGLAEAGEPTAEVTKVGAAFSTLLRQRPEPRRGRTRGPVGQLLKMLAPSA
ncbi:hypothetical protein HFP15_36995 [Amycolatopsis sp. K13G38]|uniref:Uncharacterized protein n=1 Tax=Amycolatopsis acididurans TaxID=2724524 RepID=A0ABX1JFJ6_9PSEU|nr:hypothetical protein [Amycolatopsis acididurans]NKQ58461.1 hypothetical protein [Amycolatopsis acididurans]